LGPYIAVARGYKGTLAICRGDAGEGVQNLQACLQQLQGMRYAMLSTGFRLSQVRGLVAVRSSDDALALVEDTLVRVQSNGDLLHMPEALRVKANVLLALPEPRVDDAEACLIDSLDWGRRQDARSWALRAAVDFALLRTSQHQADAAREVLVPVLKGFSEGFDTADVKAATQLLATLPGQIWRP
jgi:hypothetical protein